MWDLKHRIFILRYIHERQSAFSNYVNCKVKTPKNLIFISVKVPYDTE